MGKGKKKRHQQKKNEQNRMHRTEPEHTETLEEITWGFVSGLDLGDVATLAVCEEFLKYARGVQPPAPVALEEYEELPF